MTEYNPPVEAPAIVEDDIGRARRLVAKTRGFLREHVILPTVETTRETFSDDATRRAAGGLAIVAAASTAAELTHRFDHSGAVLEFLQGSGRHLLVGYVAAMGSIVKSKAETTRGKIAAGLIGGILGNVAVEAGQAAVITGVMHHGSPSDIASFVYPKEVVWGNAEDALAAELAAGAATAQAIYHR